MIFKNREDAGEKLAGMLSEYTNKDVVVYALPRGGVVIGAEVADKLNAPLDLIIPRKIGHPDNPEYAIGATSSNGHTVYGEDAEFIDKNWLASQVFLQKEEAVRRRKVYLGEMPPISPVGKTAILVDDGIATGLTMEVGIMDLKARKPAKIVVAVPLAPPDTAEKLADEVDEFMAYYIPEKFSGAVGSYYEEFLPVEDNQVVSIMNSLKPGS